MPAPARSAAARARRERAGARPRVPPRRAVRAATSGRLREDLVRQECARESGNHRRPGMRSAAMSSVRGSGGDRSDTRAARSVRSRWRVAAELASRAAARRARRSNSPACTSCRAADGKPAENVWAIACSRRRCRLWRASSSAVMTPRRSRHSRSPSDQRGSLLGCTRSGCASAHTRSRKRAASSRPRRSRGCVCRSMRTRRDSAWSREPSARVSVIARTRYNPAPCVPDGRASRRPPGRWSWLRTTGLSAEPAPGTVPGGSASGAAIACRSVAW